MVELRVSASRERSRSEPAVRARVRAPSVDGLIGGLHEQLSAGFHVPGSRVFVDEPLILETLDRLRNAYLEEIETARRTVQERHSMVARAQSDAQEIIASAQREVQAMLTDMGIKAAAEDLAGTILDRASGVAEQTRDAAWQYALDELTRLQDELREVAKALADSRRGLTQQL